MKYYRGKVGLINKVYTFGIYLNVSPAMKTLSLKLDDDIFNDAEDITSKLKMARNRYINEAVKIFNMANKRRLLKTQLRKESGLAAADSMEVLKEFERFLNED